MSKCTEKFIQEAANELANLNELSTRTKRKLILDRLNSNPDMLAKLLVAYEPRLKVLRNNESLIFQDAFNQKQMEEVRKTLEEVDEEGDENQTSEERTINFHEKGKLSVSKLVHQFIGTIPLLEGPGPQGTFFKGTTSEYTTNEKRAFLSSREALPLLVREYAKSPTINLHNYEDLETLLVSNMNKDSLPTDQQKILNSLHLFLFSPNPIVYVDIYGNKKSVQSVLTKAKNPDLEVARRNRNYLASLTNTIASINGESILSVTNEEGLFDADNDVYREQKAKFNTKVANNLYMVDEGPEGSTIHLRPQIIRAFKEMNVQITKDWDATRNPERKSNIYRMTLSRNRGSLAFTFALNGGKISDGREKISFTSPLAVVTHLNDGLNDFSYRLPTLLLDIFKATGIDKNLVNSRIIDDYVKNPGNQKGKGSDKTPWEQLWNVAVNNLLALAMDTELHNQYNAFDVAGSPKDSVFREVKLAVENRFSGLGEESARNLKPTLVNAFGPVAIGPGVNTFMTSPLMNFTENTKLIRQIVSSNHISPTAMQRDANNNNVNKLTTASNIEFIRKTISTIITNVRASLDSVFTRDVFINQDATGRINPKARINKIVRLSGYRDRDGNAKPLSNQNVSEINYSIHKNYAEIIKRNWNPTTLEAKVVRVFPSVLSDKTAFIGLDIQLEFNALPKDGRKLDIRLTSPLVQEYLINDKAYKDSLRQEFIAAWKKESLPTVSNGTLVPSNVTIPTEIFLGTEAEVLTKLLKVIPALTIPNTPIGLTFNKHYTGKVGGPFGVKPLFVQEMQESLRPDYTERTYRKLLAMSALNHNVTLEQGLTYDDKYQDFTRKAGFELNDWQQPVPLETFFEMNGTIPATNGLGEFIIKEFNPTVAQGLLANIHPLQQSHFLTWNIISPSVNRLLYGDVFQYKGNTMDEMLGDRLKRSVGAIAPYKRLSVDKSLTEYGNLDIPRYSDTVIIEDLKKKGIPILGNGEQKGVDIYDGGSLTFPLAEYMYQQSYGAEHGENPKASLKFFYSNTDLQTANNTLYKYAVHTLTKEVIDNGSEAVSILLKLFMGSKPFGREVNIDVITGTKDGTDVHFQLALGPTNTLLDVYNALEVHNKVNGKQDIFKQLADIISTNQNPISGQYDLKTKFVSQVVFKSSNKTGQSNAHQWQDLEARYFASGTGLMDLGPKGFKTIDNTKLGIQLDATHEPENTTVALYSQGISNALLEGRMLHEGSEMLTSLAALTKKKLTEIKNLFERDFTSEDIANSKGLRLEGLRVNGTEFPSDIRQQQDLFDNRLDPATRKKLYIRSILLTSLEAQDITNTTYQQVLDNTFSLNDPQVEQKLVAALNSHFTKQTISLSIPGGNYVLSPTSKLVEVYDVVDKEGNPQVVLHKRTVPSTYPAYGVVGEGQFSADMNGRRKGRELKWKGYMKGDKSILDTPQYKNLVSAYASGDKAKWLQAKQVLQQELATGYVATPAEVVMAYPYKQKFGIVEGMQPVDVTEEFFYKNSLLGLLLKMQPQATASTIPEMEAALLDNPTFADFVAKELPILQEQARVKKLAFDKSLNVLVGRIPSTGPQSAVVAKIVGFIDSSSNAIFIPTELMAIQGADLDIDKAVVLTWNFDEDGKFATPEVKEGTIDYENSTFEAIQNYHTEQLFSLYNDPINALATNVPVNMDSLQEQKALKGLKGYKNHIMLPYSVPNQKVLTSEGKSMVGIFANGLKAYALTYFAYRSWNADTRNKPKSIQPLSILLPGMTKPLVFHEIANQNPNLSEDQAWEMYSGLVNAATDNAKELILGAIGANLQSGNIINLLTLYGVPTKELFSWLDQPINQLVLREIAHSIDIDNGNKGKTNAVLTIDTAIKRLINENKLTKPQTTELNRIGAQAEEFSVLAKVLGINRGLPNTAFKKYQFTKSFENYINEKAANAKVTFRFSLEQFVNGTDQALWIDLYENQLMDSVNILFVLRQNPHILAYLNTKVTTDNIINREVRNQGLVKQILNDVVASSDTPFKTPNEQEYNTVSRYVNELQVFKYLQTNFSGKQSLKLFDRTELTFDLSKLEHINRYIAYFPAFFEQVKNLNPSLLSNLFISRLEAVSDRKGDYLAIPNIEDLTKGELDDLQFHLNNSHLTELSLGEKKISYAEFKKLLFIYSLIIGKGKVSRSSFFELFESQIKEDLGYNRFMDTAILNVGTENTRDNVGLLSTLVRYLPRGKGNIRLSTEDGSLPKDQATYVANPNGVPVIQNFFKGKLMAYLLSEGKYYLIKPLYKTVGISANDTGQDTHLTNDQVYVQMNNAEDVRTAIVPDEQGNKRAISLTISTKHNADQELPVRTNVGTFLHSRTTGTGVSWLKERRTLSGLDIKVGGQLLENIVTQLTRKYPSVVTSILSSDEIAEQFGERFRDNPAFTDGNQVILNRERVTMDAPMHEFGHIHLAILKQTNPELRARALELARQDTSDIAKLIRNKYADKNGDEVAEEIFVTLVGFYGTKQLMLKYPSITHGNWIHQVVNTILDFFKAVGHHLGFVGNATLDKLDLKTATMGDLVSTVSEQMLSTTLGHNLTKLDKVYLKERRNFTQVSTIDDLINTLVVREKKVDSESVTNFKETIRNLKEYVGNGLRYDKKEYPFPIYQKYMYEVAKMIHGTDWYSKYNNIYTLAEFARATEITGMDGDGPSVRKPPLGLTTDNKNILVKTRIINGKVNCELFDLNNFNFNTTYNPNKTIVGSLNVSKREAKTAGITFDASQLSVNNLRLGLIAVEAHSASDSLLFSNLISINAQSNNDIDVGGTTVEEALANLRGLATLDKVGLPKELAKKIQAIPVTDSNIRLDYVEYYRTLLTHWISQDKGRKGAKTDKLQHEELADLFKSSGQSSEDYQELVEKLKARHNFITENRVLDIPAIREELDILSKLILQISNIRDLHRRNEETTVSQIQNYTASVGTTGVGMVEFIAKKILGAMGQLRRKLLLEFKPAHDKKVDKLVEHYRQVNGSFTRLEDYTINDSRKFFENLLETKQVTDEQGNKVKVYTGELIKESSQEFTNLSTAEKEYLTYFNDQVQAAYLAMYPDKELPRGVVPILKWRNQTGTIGSLTEAWNNPNGFWFGAKKEINNWLDAQYNDLDYHYDNAKTKSPYQLTKDTFKGFMEPSAHRNDVLGLDEKGNLLDKEKNNGFERDLSTVLQLFTANGYRKQEFDKVSPYLNSINYFINLEKETFRTENDFKGKMINDYVERVVYNKVNEGNKDWHTVNKVLNKLSSQSSGIMLALNWTAALGNFVTGFSTNYRQAILNSIDRAFDKDAPVFNASHLLEAEVLIAKDWQLAGELNKLYGFNSLDYQQMTAHTSRMSQTNKSIFRSEKLFWINFIGDYYNRNTLFMAQMLKDGSYGAYAIVDGKYTYNEKLDKRFHTNGTFDPTKTIYKTIKANLRTENGLNTDGSLKYGYDNNIRNSLKFAADKIHGSYDNDFATNLNNYALGKLLLTFRKYYQNKIQQYVGGLRDGRINEVEGRYVTKIINGQEVTQWQGTWQEGVFVSIWNISRQLGSLQWSAIRPEQWKNLLLVTQDIGMLSLVAMLFHGWFDDEEEKDINPLIKSARNSLYTTYGSIDPRQYTNILNEPFITFGFWHKQVDNFVSNVALGKDGDRAKALGEVLSNTLPYYKSAEQTVHMVDYLQQGVLLEDQP